MIQYLDAFFITKTLKEDPQNSSLKKMQYTHYIQSYALAALILNASLEVISTLEIPESAKMGINASIILTLVAIVSARLRAEALNKTNLKLNSDATRIEKYTTIGYELAIGLALQLPYIILDIAKLKITDEKAHAILRYAFFICLGAALSLDIFQSIGNILVIPLEICCSKKTPQQEILITESSYQNQRKELDKYLLLEAARLFLIIIPSIVLQNFYEKNSLFTFVNLGILTLALLQKDLKATYIVYNEMRKDKWKDILAIEPVTDIENPAGVAGLIASARTGSGLPGDGNSHSAALDYDEIYAAGKAATTVTNPAVKN